MGARQLFTNNAKARLNAGITATATSLTLQAGQGALFPNPVTVNGEWFLSTIVKSTGALEVIKVTARSGDAFVAIERAQEGTTALDFDANDRIELRWTKGSVEYLRDNLHAPSGTRMFFQQTTAPLYWTKVADPAYNDAAIRVVTGAASVGGADDFSAVFGVGKATAAYALTVADMPAHSHAVTDPGHFHMFDRGNSNYAEVHIVTPGDPLVQATGQTYSATTGITIANAGGGVAHAHSLGAMNIKYADTILCAKD